jgi:uncharacterized protein YktA (UPF0223 family)
MNLYYAKVYGRNYITSKIPDWSSDGIVWKKVLDSNHLSFILNIEDIFQEDVDSGDWYRNYLQYRLICKKMQWKEFSINFPEEWGFNYLDYHKNRSLFYDVFYPIVDKSYWSRPELKSIISEDGLPQIVE